MGPLSLDLFDILVEGELLNNMREKPVLCTNSPAHQRAPVSAKTTIFSNFSPNSEYHVWGPFAQVWRGGFSSKFQRLLRVTPTLITPRIMEICPTRYVLQEVKLTKNAKIRAIFQSLKPNCSTPVAGMVVASSRRCRGRKLPSNKEV